MTNSSECALCQCRKSTLIQKGARHAAEVEVRRCMDCGLVFLWPRPTEEGLDKYYEEVYREDYAEPGRAHPSGPFGHTLLGYRGECRLNTWASL